MNHKRLKKKPPTGQGRGGKSENQSGGNVFSIQDNTIYPRFFQNEFSRIADTYRLRSDFWRVMAKAARILAILQITEVHNDD